MKLHLIVKGLWATIEEATNVLVDDANKPTVMIFIWRNIHDALHTEYITKEDPRAFWLTLADHFDY